MFTRKNILLVFLFINVCYSGFTQNFVTTWATTTASEQITIPTSGGGYSYTVNWGVGEPIDATVYTGDASHTYATAGTYTVTITGTFRRIYFNNTGDKDKIQSIEEWGSNHSWTSMSRAFEGCTNLVNNASDTPDLSSTSTLARMFYGASSIGGASETGNWAWDLSVSSIANLSQMFRDATVFNKDISGWYITNITNLSNTFSGANAFNQDLSMWDTSSVANMSATFRNANAFNQDLSMWDTSSVTTMSNMFNNATVFNQDIDGWDVSSVTNMDNMFYGAAAFNQDLNSWVVTSVTNMSDMFRGTPFNGNIVDWATSSATNMSNMFRDATSFNQDIGGWTTSSVSNFSVMFRGATSFNQDISMWNTTAALNISQMFYDATSFNQDISGWDVSSVTVMNNMFRGATAFNQDIGGWDTSSATNMNNMFRGATAFDQDLSGWDVSLVTNFNNMFRSVTLSPANYNALLIGWNAQSLQPGEAFHGGNSKYCSAAAIAAKANMISSDGWSFNDGGELTSFTWSGATDTDWNDPSNWQDGYTPDCSIDISIPSVTNHPIIDASTEVTVDNLTINSGATLTIEGGLTVEGDLTTNDGLTINSGGSIIVNGTSTGNLTYNRNIPVANKWYQISPPVSGETIENYISNNSLQTGNGNVGLYYYDNSTALGFLGTGYIFYTPSSTGSFIAGRGYGTQVSSASDVTFTGTMPTADVGITVATGTIDNSNLVGNPFPSYLPANTNANANNLLTNNTGVLSEETLWIWDNTINDYVAINNASAATYVAPAQSFFVDGSGSGTFNMNESWQSHQSTDVFYKNTNEISSIKLTVKNMQNEIKSTEIYFYNNKTIGFDNGFDSSQLPSGSNLNIYTRLIDSPSNAIKLAIQTLPKETIEDHIIPIGISGSSTISFNADFNNISNDLYLEDTFNNTITKLEKGKNIDLILDENNNDSNRFYLRFNSKSLSLETESLNLIDVFLSENKTLNLNRLPLENISIKVYSILGQQAYNKSFINKTSHQKISLSTLKNGVYFVKIKTNKGYSIKKILLQ